MILKNDWLTIKRSTQFKRDLKKALKQSKNIDLLEQIVTLLQQGIELPQKYRDHPLSGVWRSYRECHLEPDWLLIYKVNKRELLLHLARVGSHAELFQ